MYGFLASGVNFGAGGGRYRTRYNAIGCLGCFVVKFVYFLALVIVRTSKCGLFLVGMVGSVDTRIVSSSCWSVAIHRSIMTYSRKCISRRTSCLICLQNGRSLRFPLYTNVVLLQFSCAVIGAWFAVCGAGAGDA